MNTFIILVATTLIIIINSPDACNDFNIQLEDETYINDIPFDTENVLNDFDLNINSVSPKDVFEVEPEKYIDDIPFNTKEIFDTHVSK